MVITKILVLFSCFIQKFRCMTVAVLTIEVIIQSTKSPSTSGTSSCLFLPITDYAVRKRMASLYSLSPS